MLLVLLDFSNAALAMLVIIIASLMAQIRGCMPTCQRALIIDHSGRFNHATYRIHRYAMILRYLVNSTENNAIQISQRSKIPYAISNTIHDQFG